MNMFVQITCLLVNILFFSHHSHKTVVKAVEVKEGQNLFSSSIWYGGKYPEDELQ